MGEVYIKMICKRKKILNKIMDRLLKLKHEADDAYFNTGTPIMSDEVYDGLCQHVDAQRASEDLSTQRASIGCIPPAHLHKVELPVYMGSLTKHNDDKKLENFLNKFNHKSFFVQEKLDGVSCLYVSSSSGTSLYTRGNGVIGTNISHLLNYGLNVPILTNSTPFMVRGELIMTKKIFEDKYASEFKNIRNMVSGQLNTKDPCPTIISNLDFITYELIEPQKTYQKCLSEQYKFLKGQSFKVVYNRIVEREYIKQLILMDYLERRKNKSQYQIDGLVITINGEYERNESENPKYSIAFKIQGQTAEVEVNFIKWNLSKSGKYKPQIFIKPVELAGVTISSLTGFNAKYIVANNIGKGAKLLITRSGDVIPHIITVLSNCSNVELPQNSRWDSVDLYHTFEETPDHVVIKQMVHFFTSLQCPNCKDKTLLKVYNAGYKTIESIIHAKIDDLSKIEGIGDVLAKKLISSIHTKIREASVFELLAALNSFGEGIGLKKIQNIDLNNPEKRIHGLSEVTIKEKILPVWNSSLERVKNIKKIVDATFQLQQESPTALSSNHCWKNRTFVFTGFRDISLEKQISNLGGKVTTSISQKTTDLITASDHDENSSTSSTKLIKAKNLGINITTKLNLIRQIQQIQIHSSN